MTTSNLLYPQMAWWTGIIEDRDDPLEIGRLRVRINGYHNSSKALIPTEDLPWASVVQPITSQALDGIGQSPTGVAVGTHVIGFFSDGAENCQEPIIWGSISGINVSTGESDTPRLARSKGIINTDTFEEDSTKTIDKLDTILVNKLENAINDTDNGFKEPKPTYAGRYPTNHVHQTESGHVIEIDDTPTAERLHRYHTSGTYEEIGPSGERIVKIVGKDWLMVVSDREVYIDGSIATIITGNETVTVNGNSNVIIDGNSNITVAGNATLTIDGNFTLNVAGAGSIICDGPLTLKGSILNIN